MITRSGKNLILFQIHNLLLFLVVVCLFVFCWVFLCFFFRFAFIFSYKFLICSNGPRVADDYQ